MDAQISWYRTPVDREQLRQLAKRSNLKGLIQAGSFLLIFLATSAAAVYLFTKRLWLPMIVVCYFHAIFQNFISMTAAVHELSHGTPFKSKRLNEFFYGLFCFLTWNNPVHFRASHRLHHQVTLYSGQDNEVVQEPVGSKLNWGSLFRWATFDYRAFARFMRATVLHAIGHADADFFEWHPLFPAGDARRKQMCNWARVILFGHILLIVAFAFLDLWVLIYLVSFGSFFAGILAKLCGALQHTGLRGDVPDWRINSHTVILGPMGRFLYWSMNYHIEHHMYAAVPFYNLRALHNSIKHDTPVPQRGFLNALRLLRRIAREQRRDPQYVYVPDLPESAAPARLG